MADRSEREPAGALQLGLFPDRVEGAPLDRVHAAMLLQASGRTNALRALLRAELDRGPDFLRLANALSALYPKERKRSGYWMLCCWLYRGDL